MRPRPLRRDPHNYAAGPHACAAAGYDGANLVCAIPIAAARGQAGRRAIVVSRRSIMALSGGVHDGSTGIVSANISAELAMFWT